jgi:hypothetical protein
MCARRHVSSRRESNHDANVQAKKCELDENHEKVV